MITRRHTLMGAAALALAPAATLARDNPMPESLRRDLERDPTAPVLGNPKGDVTLTEFFDYNCKWCRKMVPVIQRLISADPGLRVVYREWPVFGAGSDFAARASLASLPQGKYWQFHAALMQAGGRITEPVVMRVARDTGLDVARLRRDMEAASISTHISNSMRLADHMGLMGTPSFIAGDEGAFGFVALKELQAMVDRARKTLKS